MKSGRTLVQLAQEIDRQKASKLDLLTSTTQVTMSAPGDPNDPTARGGLLGIEIAGRPERFGITAHAHHQIAAGTEIPRAYYQRMMDQAPGLLATNVNEWLTREPANRMVRVLDGRVRAWLSSRYRPLDNEQIIEFLGPIFMAHGARLEIVSCEITERRLYIKVAYPSVQGEIKKGDVVQSGFVISNSEVGAGTLSCFPWILRLVCLNGMKVESAGQRRNHVGRNQEIEAGQVIEYREDTQRTSDKAIMLRLRDTVEACLQQNTFDRILGELRTSAETSEVQHPEKAIEILAKPLALNDTERGSVLRHLIKGGDLTAWGMANAVTRAAEDAADYDRASELEQAGYAVVQMTSQAGAWEAVATAGGAN